MLLTTTNEWQPIETAPRDGTHVLVCQAEDVDGNPIAADLEAWGLFVQVAGWWEDDEDEAAAATAGDWMVYCSLVQEPSLHFEPSHWSPLPPGPGAADLPEIPSEDPEEEAGRCKFQPCPDPHPQRTKWIDYAVGLAQGLTSLAVIWLLWKGL